MKKIIAIDLGSNSLRILKFDCATKCQIGVFHRTVKTADGLAQTGEINKQAVVRVVTALNDAKIELSIIREKYHENIISKIQRVTRL